MKAKVIAVIQVPAIGAVKGWIRTVKTIHISSGTPKWMIDCIHSLPRS